METYPFFSFDVNEILFSSSYKKKSEKFLENNLVRVATLNVQVNEQPGNYKWSLQFSCRDLCGFVWVQTFNNKVGLIIVSHGLGIWFIEKYNIASPIIVDILQLVKK